MLKYLEVKCHYVFSLLSNGLKKKKKDKYSKYGKTLTIVESMWWKYVYYTSFSAYLKIHDNKYLRN